MKFFTLTVSKTFQTITPESAEQRDFAETGFVFESQPMRLKDFLSEVRDIGCFEWSSSNPSSHDWITSTDPDRDYETAEETYECLHFLDGLKPNQVKRIIEILKGGN